MPKQQQHFGRWARPRADRGAPPGPARSKAGNKSISPVHVWKRRTIPNALPHPCQILPTGFGPNVLQMICKCPKNSFGQAAPKSSRKHLLNIWRVAEKLARLQKYLQNICSWGNFLAPRQIFWSRSKCFANVWALFPSRDICKTFAKHLLCDPKDCSWVKNCCFAKKKQNICHPPIPRNPAKIWKY